MGNKRVERLIELKNAREVIRKYESKEFKQSIFDVKRIGGRLVEPNIKHDGELMLNLFDEKSERKVKSKKK